MMTNTALSAIQTTVLSSISSGVTHIAVGSGTTAPSVTDTTLVTETYRDAVLSEITAGNTYTAQLYLDTTEDNGNNIKEIGLFSASSGGTMYERALTNIIAKTSSVEVFAEINIMVSVENA